jgi:hypothetical protein
MKRTTLALIAGIGLVLAGSAGANQNLDAVNVNSSALDCTPPSDSQLCSAWHAEIRRNFSSREIGMLFGAATSYPEYRNRYSSVKERYERLQGEFAATHMSGESVASK